LALGPKSLALCPLILASRVVGLGTHVLGLVTCDLDLCLGFGYQVDVVADITTTGVAREAAGGTDAPLGLKYQENLLSLRAEHFAVARVMHQKFNKILYDFRTKQIKNVPLKPIPFNTPNLKTNPRLRVHPTQQKSWLSL